MSTDFFVGAGLGQSRDPSTIAVVERAEVMGPFDPVMFAYQKLAALRLRHVERIPLGTGYPEVVRRLAEVARSRELTGRCRLVVDATGVGRPVVDLLRDARPGCLVMPVVVTSGEQETSSGGYYCVPKRDLIVGLQVLMQTGGLQFAKGMKFGVELAAEMAAMEVRVSPAGREQYGAWREGAHDDLVFAVALSCWGAAKAYPRSEGWWSSERWGL